MKKIRKIQILDLWSNHKQARENKRHLSGESVLAYVEYTLGSWYHRPINIYPDAVPPIHAVSSHVATDKDPSK